MRHSQADDRQGSEDRTSCVIVQVGAFGDPGRDPRCWTITVAYAALVPSTSLGVKAAVSGDAGCMCML